MDLTTPIASLLDLPFWYRACIVGGGMGAASGLLGVFVVLRRLSFIGAGIAHAAFAGIALSLLLGAPVLGGTLVFCIIVSLGVGYVSQLGRIPEESVVGISFAASMALGVFLLSLVPTERIDIVGYLFGSLLGVSRHDLVVVGLVVIGVIGVAGVFLKELIELSFDEELAKIGGVKAVAIHYLFLVLLTVTIVVSIRAVGIILASSLLVTPAVTALQLTNRIRPAILISVALGVGTTELGILFSFVADSPPGATIVLFQTVVFLIVTLVTAFRRGLRHKAREPERQVTSATTPATT